MREKIPFALRRPVTMSNLLESLAASYGGEGILLADGIGGYRRFPAGSLSRRDAVIFTNLVAEALIRDLDLKKGERVVIVTPHPAEMLLLFLGAVKAGGIAVPLDHKLPTAEIAARASACRASVAIIDGSLLMEVSGLLGCLGGKGRLAASGPREEALRGSLSLDRAMEEGSGFFLPYTLKPSSVIGLFYSPRPEGMPPAVMVTNQALLGIRRTVSLFLPGGPGKLCTSALSLASLSGLSAVVLALCMGMELRLLPDTIPAGEVKALQASGACVFMGDAAALDGLAGYTREACRTPGVRLWLCAGGEAQPLLIKAFLDPGSRRMDFPGLAPLFVESLHMRDSTTMVALKVSLRVPGGEIRNLTFPLPPNRFMVLAEDRRPARRGEEGELLVKGPAVTPGYWNNLDGFFRVTREGWLRTGIRARRGPLPNTFRAVEPPIAPAWRENR